MLEIRATYAENHPDLSAATSQERTPECRPDVVGFVTKDDAKSYERSPIAVRRNVG